MDVVECYVRSYVWLKTPEVGLGLDSETLRQECLPQGDKGLLYLGGECRAD